jgi:hypothetical protein
MTDEKEITVSLKYSDLGLEALVSGANGFLIKPLNPDLFLEEGVYHISLSYDSEIV